MGLFIFCGFTRNNKSQESHIKKNTGKAYQWGVLFSDMRILINYFFLCMEVYPRGSFWFLVKTSMLCAGYIERRGGKKRREKKERLKNTPFRKKGRFQE